MPFQFSRRAFLGSSLGSSFILSTLPASLWAEQADEVIFRFAVMSDIHYPGNPHAAEVARFEKALRFMNDYSAKQSYSKFDLLLIAGDISNHGTSNEIDPFKASLDAGIRPGTSVMMCMGNHEFWGGSRELWEKTFGFPANSRREIGGYQFIALSPEKGTMRNGDYFYAVDWLKTELDAAMAADSEKPVFLIQHYHITPTVYGSRDFDNNGGTSDLFDILQGYPRVVDFSGHSHFPINDPRSAWQGEFTAFGTGTLSYFAMTAGRYDSHPKNNQNAAQFYVVEIHRDHSLSVRPYDLITDSFFDIVRTVARPGNRDTYLYTDARYHTSKKPVWTPGSAIEASEIGPYGGRFRFPQAIGEDIVHSYRLESKIRRNGKWVKDSEKFVWSEYYFKEMPKVMDVRVNDLDEASEYRMEISAVNPYYKESDEKLTFEFTTSQDPNETVDRTAERPDANLLDVTFHDGDSHNAPVNGLEKQKSMIVFGRPEIIADEELKNEVASFNGTEDFFRINFSEEEYAHMTRRISLAVQFKFDRFEGNRAEALFANTETGGIGLQIQHEKKTLEFWIYLNGGYKILSAPVEPGRWHTAFGTYDGQTIRLYLDGKKAAEQNHPGRIAYTGSDRARAFCIGADVDPKNGGNALFKGKIAFARLYSWALTEKQIAQF